MNDLELTEIDEVNNNYQWQYIGASVQGSSHENNDLPCQDFHCVSILPNDKIVIAIADGAGSASMAQAGAEIVVKSVIKELEISISNIEVTDFATFELSLVNAVVAAKQAIEVEALEQNIEVKEFASTLLITIATPDLVVSAQIGDGGIVIKNIDGELIGLTDFEISEYINVATFLTSSDALDKLKIKTWHGNIYQIAMFSDGLQLLCLKFPQFEPFEPFFSSIFNFAKKNTDDTQGKEKLINFLKSDKIREESDDDITLVLSTLCINNLCQPLSNLEELQDHSS